MSDATPELHMLNLVVGDTAASVDFYRRLVELPSGEEPSGVHVAMRTLGGLSLELDTAESVWLWHAQWADPASTRWSSASPCRAGRRWTTATPS